MAGQEYTETSKRNKKYQHTKDSVQEPPTRAAPKESLNEAKEDKEEFDSRKKVSRRSVQRTSAYREKLRDHESIPREEIIENKEAIQKKQQRKRLTEEQKKVSKLSFDDEGGMIAGAGTGFGRKAAGLGSAAVSGYVHNKLHQEGDDNEIGRAHV